MIKINNATVDAVVQSSPANYLISRFDTVN